MINREFSEVIHTVVDHFLNNHARVNAERWQGIPTKGRPEMATWEYTHVYLVAAMNEMDLNYYRREIRPNLPWADDHFETERVSGHPINPGNTWKHWPYGHSAAKALDERGQFNHTYAERYWPRHAGHTPDGIVDDRTILIPERVGIRGEYGDLAGVVRLLASEPLTRQAYLPVWFPEDTGDVHYDRKPCTIGYHFLMRNGQLDVTYHIRSCDILRHFRDDIYLTVRLVIWIINECTKRDGLWRRVRPGTFNMMIGSLHCFANDLGPIREQLENKP